MEDWQHDRIGAAQRGTNPTVLMHMRSGFAVFGDTQFLPGYCVLLAAPQVEQLLDLLFDLRRTFLDDMGLLGEAIMETCHPRRVNYEILGNTDHYLHAHVFPRYDWETAERRGWGVFSYPVEMWTHQQFHYANSAFANLRERIRGALADCMQRAGAHASSTD